MSTRAQPEPDGEEPVRLRLARVAAQAAREHVDVAGLDERGGLRSTLAGSERVSGVVVSAAGERYEVVLHLVARMVPLPALAEAVRERVAAAADEAGLGSALGPVDVVVEDVLAGGEEP